VCAGGITRKGFQMMQIPDEVIEHKVDEVRLHSGKYHNVKHLPEPVMYTVDRKVFGKWQCERLKGTSIEVRLNSKVTRVEDKFVVINDEEEIAYDYLVGGDGPNSIVRRFLKLPLEKVLATIQYIIPVKGQTACMEIYLDAKYFHSWYAWSFPHHESIAIGVCADPRYVSGKRLKEKAHRWIEEKGFDLSNARYESYPISYDYRGIEFGNIFLVGEAAGMASGLTGEGIFQSLVSGQEAAYRILKQKDPTNAFEFVLKYNRIQLGFLNFSLKSGPVRYLLADLIILLMRNPWINKKISKGFS
jgi:geranylgeranyl reductase